MSESTTEYTKPLPRGEGVHGEFYAHCKNHELRFQHCSKCGAWQHMPRDACRECGSFDLTWETSTGRGKIFTWTIIHRALQPRARASTTPVLLLEISPCPRNRCAHIGNLRNEEVRQ